MKNIDVKCYAISKNVKFWQIAEKLNMKDSNFSRLLRYDLEKEKKEQIISIIDEISSRQ